MVTIFRQKKGVTLPELLITACAIGLLMGFAPKMLIDFSKHFRLSRAKAETRRDTRDTLQLIIRELKLAKRSTVVISQNTNQPPYSKIRFKDIDSNTNMFYQEGSILYFSRGGKKHVVTKNLGVITFSFTNSSLTTVNAFLSLQQTVGRNQNYVLSSHSEDVPIMNE